MITGAKNTGTRSMRDVRTNDRAYQEWQAARALEVEQENGAAQAAQAALDAANPVKTFQQASNAEAQAVLETIRTGFVPESILPVERLNGRMIVNEQAAINNFKYFAESTASFHYYMADALLSAAERSQIIPTAPAYTALHNLMLQFGAYPEPPAQPAVEQPVAVAEEVVMRMPSEIAEARRYDFFHKVVVTDPRPEKYGTKYAEADLRRLPATEERFLRRYAEKGHSGSAAYDEYLEVKDKQSARDAEIAQRGAEDQR